MLHHTMLHHAVLHCSDRSPHLSQFRRGLDLNSESANASRPMPNSDLSACRAPAPLSDSQRSPRCARSCVAACHYTPRTWRVVLSQSSACHPTQVHAAALVSRLASRSRRFALCALLVASFCAACRIASLFVCRVAFCAAFYAALRAAFRAAIRAAFRALLCAKPCSHVSHAFRAKRVCLVRRVSRETCAGQLRVSLET